MAHPDLDALLNTLLPFAQEQLSKRGSFLPFGASMNTAGAINLAAGYTEREAATPQDLIDLIEKGFAAAATGRTVPAVGVCIDSLVVPPGQTAKTDAICCSLEHASGEAMDVFLPYRKALLGRLKYGELFAVPGAPRTFESPAAT